ncbi:MAG TPA: LysE family translocator [Gammaproteobacteria bacterium]|nr:LysE family translocator [Gammaproteobacteria bacterium]
MQSSLTFSGTVALFGVMIVGALIPGVGVLVVSARSAASGFIHGAFTTLGIVVGDIIFILLAILGLSILVETMGDLFVLVKYLGGAYLVWLGIALWRSKLKTVEAEGAVDSSLLSSFMTGLFITLGDQKAILFYFGVFPAFFDLSAMSYFDVSIIVVIAIVAVGGVKLGYAFMVDRSKFFLINPRVRERMNKITGCVMIGAGIFLVATN